jgi:hypothetical protein
MDEKSAEITNRTVKAMGEHHDWLMEYVKKYGGQGQPLPYHPNFGITEEEYKIALTAKLMVRPVRSAPLSLLRNNQGDIQIAAAAELLPLNGIIFKLSDSSVTTPFGKAGTPSVPKASSDDYLGLGPVQMYSWKAENASGDPSDWSSLTGSSFELRVGMLTASGRGILVYRARRIEHGSPLDNVILIITFPIPPNR